MQSAARQRLNPLETIIFESESGFQPLTLNALDKQVGQATIQQDDAKTDAENRQRTGVDFAKQEAAKAIHVQSRDCASP